MPNLACRVRDVAVNALHGCHNWVTVAVRRREYTYVVLELKEIVVVRQNLPIISRAYGGGVLFPARQSGHTSTEFSTDFDPPVGTTITLTREDDWWVATDEETGVVSQGKSRAQALENLDEALAGYYGTGEPPNETELHEMGIDPEQNTSGSRDDSDIFE